MTTSTSEHAGPIHQHRWAISAATAGGTRGSATSVPARHCDGHLSSPSVRCRPPGAGCRACPPAGRRVRRRSTCRWRSGSAGGTRSRSAATAGWRVRLAAPAIRGRGRGSSRPAPWCTGASGADDVVGGPDLDDAAEVHHRDPVGDDPRDREVVGHEHHRHVQRAAKVADEVEHRGGQRDVERAGRLVAQQHRRRHHGGPRQRHPLALTAGELTRPRLRDVRRQADPLEHLGDRVAVVALRDMPFRRSRSAISSPTDSHGVSDAPASWNTICGRWPPASSTVPRSRFLQAGDDPQQRRLARAALADQRDRFAVGDASAKRRAALEVCRRP